MRPFSVLFVFVFVSRKKQTKIKRKSFEDNECEHRYFISSNGSSLFVVIYSYRRQTDTDFHFQLILIFLTETARGCSWRKLLWGTSLSIFFYRWSLWREKISFFVFCF